MLFISCKLGSAFAKLGPLSTQKTPKTKVLKKSDSIDPTRIGFYIQCRRNYRIRFLIRIFLLYSVLPHGFSGGRPGSDRNNVKKF